MDAGGGSYVEAPAEVYLVLERRDGRVGVKQVAILAVGVGAATTAEPAVVHVQVARRVMCLEPREAHTPFTAECECVNALPRAH